ncbi:MAG: Hsp20/alpha crystallin family protein [Chloroflexi bacterium]|nr:Hsp20/alpha crystallin family protein [Chloroflexota bacterium]
MESMLRYQPVSTLAGWPARSRIDRLFDRVFDEAVIAVEPSRGFTGANLYESPEAYLVEIPLPGVKAEDVQITVQDNLLTLNARRRWEVPQNAQPIWRSFGTGEVQQTVTLPGEVNAEAVQADLHDGILRLELPKAESARPRTIKVNGMVRGASSAVSLPAIGVVETPNG